MSLTSTTFLILFLPIYILINYWINDRHRNAFLCGMSIIFYAWCGVRFLILILLSASLAHLWGCVIECTKGKKKRAFLITGITIQLGILFYYKYFYDLVSSVMPVLAQFSGGKELFSFDSPVLPLGISFYTFSILSYLLDIYWGICSAPKRISQVYLYVLFFPKVVQGPIMRYGEFESQLAHRTVDLESLDAGLERFVKGMVKKVMIADQLQNLVAYSFSDISGVGTIPAWIGIISYMCQLYYDFSGYSDMAIGLGKIAGFSLPENFDHPYMSASVAEYWRRWHISLGSWFRDYVYTPCLRGMTSAKWAKNLKQPFVVCDILALIVTWSLTGIWHGSGLNFLLFGLWFCAFIVFERLQNNRRKKLRKQGKIKTKQKSVWQKAMDHIVTMFAVIFGTVIFRADSVQTAWMYMKRLVIWNKTDGLLFLQHFDNYLVFILVVALLFVFPVYEPMKNKLLNMGAGTRLGAALLFVYKVGLFLAFLVVFSYAVSAGYQAFLYEIF